MPCVASMTLSNKERIVVEVTNAKLKIFFNVLDNIRKKKISDDNEKFDLEIDLLLRFFNIVFRIPSSSLKISQVCSEKVEEADKSTPRDNWPQIDSYSSAKDDDVESLPDDVLEAEGAMCDEEEEVIDDFDDIVETLGPERRTQDLSTEKETQIESLAYYSDTDLNCKICGFIAGRNHSLKLHIEMVHLVFYYYCNFCDYQHKDKYEQRKHIRETHNESATKLYQTPMRFHCNACEYTDTISLFRQHMVKDHPELKCFYIQARTGPKSKDRHESCEFCGKLTLRMPMNFHVEKYHMKTEYQCKKCDIKTLRRTEIRDHILKLHLKIDLNPNTNRQKIPLDIKQQFRDMVTRTCTICNEKLLFIENMTNHIKDNHPNEYYSGPLLDRRRIRKKFRIKKKKISKKEARKRNSNSYQRYPCNECDYSNNLRSSLKLHMMSNHMKTIFMCQMCDFENSNINTIIRHDKNQHISKLAFRSTCRACNKHFDKLDEFKQHIESAHCSHIERYQRNTKQDFNTEIQKLHKEDTNQLQNLYKTNLKRKNKRNAEGEGKYSCRDCQYSSDIGRHTKIHITRTHMSTQFNCKSCGYECKNENEILSHIKNDHEDDQSMIGSLCGGKCDKYFENYQQFKDHGKVHFGYLNIKKYKHKNQNIANAGSKVDGVLMHKCNQDGCDFVSTKACVRIHIMTKHMRANFTCSLCKMDFRNVNLASRHAKRVHDKDLSSLKSYCGACDYASDDLLAFDRHTMNVHCPHLRPKGLMGKRRWKDFSQ